MSVTSRSDVVRRFYSALSARDLDALLDTLDPDVAVKPLLGILFDRHIFRGHAEMTAFFEQLAAGWDAFEGRVEHVRDVGDEVVAIVRLIGHRGEQSLDAQIGVECRFTGDRISSLVGCDPEEIAEKLTLIGLM